MRFPDAIEQTERTVAPSGDKKLPFRIQTGFN